LASPSINYGTVIPLSRKEIAHRPLTWIERS